MLSTCVLRNFPFQQLCGTVRKTVHKKQLLKQLVYKEETVEAICVLRNFPFQQLWGIVTKTVSKQQLLKQFVYSATSLFNNCEEQLQRQCPNSNCWRTTRQQDNACIQLWEPSSTSLLSISPQLCGRTAWDEHYMGSLFPLSPSSPSVIDRMRFVWTLSGNSQSSLRAR